MRRLAIETAGPVASVALFEGDVLVGFEQLAPARGQAEKLVGMIDRMTPGRIDEILVDAGPGSFTGIRVGLAAAIGLGIGWGVPVRAYGALSLIAAVAAPTVNEGDELFVAIEGGHGQLFVQAFRTGPLAAIGAPASVAPAEAIVAAGSRKVFGNAVGTFPAAQGVDVDARDVTRLPSELRSVPPVPIYGRAADARPRP